MDIRYIRDSPNQNNVPDPAGIFLRESAEIEQLIGTKLRMAQYFQQRRAEDFRQDSGGGWGKSTNRTTSPPHNLFAPLKCGLKIHEINLIHTCIISQIIHWKALSRGAVQNSPGGK